MHMYVGSGLGLGPGRGAAEGVGGAGAPQRRCSQRSLTWVFLFSLCLVQSSLPPWHVQQRCGGVVRGMPARQHQLGQRLHVRLPCRLRQLRHRRHPRMRPYVDAPVSCAGRARSLTTPMRAWGGGCYL